MTSEANSGCAGFSFASPLPGSARQSGKLSEALYSVALMLTMSSIRGGADVVRALGCNAQVVIGGRGWF